MAQEYSLLQPTFGLESLGAYGVAVSPTGMLSCIKDSSFDLGPEQSRETSGTAGYGLLTRDLLNTELSKGSFKSMLGYRGFGWLMNSGRGAYYINQTPTSGVYIHVWDLLPNITNVSEAQSYTCQLLGSDGVGMQANGVVFDGIKIATTRTKQHDVSVSMFGNALSQTLSPAGTVESNVQVITLSGSPSAGSFQLLIQGAVIVIAYDAIASTIQTSIRLLGSFYTNSTVSGSAGGPWTVTTPASTGTEGYGPVPKFQVNYSALTGGTAAVAVTTIGGYTMTPDITAQPTDLSVQFSSTFAGLDSAPKATASLFTTDFDFGPILEQVWTQAAGLSSPQYLAQKKAADIKDMISVSMAYDTDAQSVVQNLLTFSQAGIPTPMFLRGLFTGPQIASTTYNNTIQVDMTCIVTWKAMKDSEGNIWGVDFECNARFDTGSGLFTRVRLINNVPDYNTSF